MSGGPADEKAAVAKAIHMLTYADLGDSLAAQTRADKAIAAWSHAVGLIEGMSSDRIRKAVASIRPTLAVYSRRGVPGARRPG